MTEGEEAFVLAFFVTVVAQFALAHPTGGLSLLFIGISQLVYMAPLFVGAVLLKNAAPPSCSRSSPAWSPS